MSTRQPVAVAALVALLCGGCSAAPSGPAGPTTPGPSTSGPAAVSVPGVAGTSGGDTRTVTEPVLPSRTCATVTATLTLAGRTFSPAAERVPPDSARIQRALDRCAGRAAPVAVRLAARGRSDAFLSGPLTVRTGEVLVIDSGVTLYAARNPSVYQISGRPTCGSLAAEDGGCRPLIQVSGANAGVEGVRADGPGGRTGGRIDGRGDQDMLGTTTTWWALAEQAKIRGSFQNNPKLIQATDADNFTLYDLDLVNAPFYHVSYEDGNGFTAWGVRIKTPVTARNTDGIDPSGATHVTITHCYIQDGDDGVAVKGGRPASDMTIADNHFYGTHGISIGSETTGGVTNILFSNNTLTGTDDAGSVAAASAGIRIKSSPASGGEVTDVTYRDTCISAVTSPVDVDADYASGVGSSVPSFTGILITGVTVVNSPSGARSVLDGYAATRPLVLTLENIRLDNSASTSRYADVSLANSTLTPSGPGVTINRLAAHGAAPRCSFPAFPAL